MPFNSTICSQLLFDGYHDTCVETGVVFETLTSCGATGAPTHVCVYIYIYLFTNHNQQ
jgi:hypothetical protein